MEDTTKLPELIKAINISYHHYYRKKYKYKGHLWHSRYRSIIIKNDTQWLQCGRYIELNPVNAKLCSEPGLYKWTSFNCYAEGKLDPLLDLKSDDPKYPKLHKIETGKSNPEYRRFILAGINFDYQSLKKKYETENWGRSSV